MISIIAWRNIWRNKLRSSVVIFSILLGIWAGVFVLGFSLGLNNQRIESALNSTISHVQIHHPKFLEEYSFKYQLANPTETQAFLNLNEKVKAFTARSVVNGMVSSSAGAAGVKIFGVYPELESQTTDLHQMLIEGDYFKGISKNPVVIGEKLAEKLKLKLRSKVVLTFQDEQGEMLAAAFRVAGIFKSPSTKYDESNLFIRQQDVARLLDVKHAPVHGIALLAENMENIEQVQQEIQAEFPLLKVRSWKEVSPEMGYSDEVMAQSLYIIIVIIMLALAFGIINTMLMAVLERKRELGMLMAVGMNKMRVFWMIVTETIYLSLLGGPTGIFLGWLTIQFFQKQGIDLSLVGEGMESLGLGTMVYPELESSFYVNIALMVVVTAILASIYPARKALKLKPAETVRAI
jgi:putative ABC transport system permease protein